jgi:uncharacterized SAM-binding protein YcdF (DUF218 family)
MFFILSKILYYLLLPFTWIILIMGIVIFSKKAKVKKLASISAFTLLLFFSNDFIINEILLSWEIQAKPILDYSDDYDLGIILTGVTSTDKKPSDRTYFHKGADRVMHPVQLYKLGKIKKILVSGGSGRLVDVEIKEAESIARVLRDSGIPEEDIMLELNSNNTYENAKFSAEIIKEKFSGKKLLLITSAFHMRRAKACFDKQGLYPDVFPGDFYTFERKYSPDVFIPNAYALSKWETFIKEIAGMLMYKLAGYID